VGNGGAIYLSNSDLDMSHSYLNENNGVRGGAIFHTGVGGSSFITNTLIYSNTSTLTQGSGIHSANGTVTLKHVTLANNTGGARYWQVDTDLVAQNSIAWGNTNGGFVMTGGSMIGIYVIDQSMNIGQLGDPGFVDPGAGEDYHLENTSPAVDACPTGEITDLENQPRPQGGGYDMGAYERSGEYLILLPCVLKKN